MSNITKEDKKTYSCPMHPDEKSNEPGKCPVCSMNLVEDDSNKDE